MKKKRAIRDDWTNEDVQFLASLGIKAEVGRMTFRIDENEVYYQIKNRYEYRWNSLSDIPFYEYNDEEIESAEYFICKTSYGCGYPQPDADFKYKSLCFDYKLICPNCGCGRIQTNDLRINKISKRGFWTFCSWLLDEFFVSKEIYEDVFAPYGIGKRNVIKGGKILNDVFQLEIPVIGETLDLSDRDSEFCPICGRTRYSNQHYRFPFFPLHKYPLPGIYKTMEYFGTGHQSQREVVLSKDVAYELIASKNLKKEWLIPCIKDYDRRDL